MQPTEAPGEAFGLPHVTGDVAAWMTVGEARAVIAASGQRALPVVGHDGLVGLITVEALSGHGRDHEGGPPAAEAPVLSVMDWHLVQMAADADEQEVVAAFTAAAWRWLTHRHLEAEGPTPQVEGGARR